MNSISDECLENLYSLYSIIGSNKDLGGLYENNDFKYVFSSISIWPNAFFDLNMNTISPDLIDFAFSERNLKSPLPVFITNEDKNLIQVFRNRGYLPIERWTGMEMELNQNYSESKFENNNYEFRIISTTYELSEWTSLVSRELFSNKNLPIIIFSFLITNKNECFGLFYNNRMIGSVLIYYGEMNIAGIYMTCIDKEYRKKGLGKILISNTIDHIRKSKKNKIVLQSTKAACLLYKNLGFTTIKNYNLFWKIKSYE